MKLRSPTNISALRPKAAAGFTLVEMLVAFAIGVVLVGTVATVTVDTLLNYAAMGNYTVMDNQSRNALDEISREVRNASALVAFSTNAPQYLKLTNATSGVTVTITFTNNTLQLAKTGQTTETLLTGCNRWNFSLYNHYPNITSNSISFNASTNYTTGNLDPTFAKVINMVWSSSRSILGTKLNTESVQTAQVILRNKVK
jgi:Tfp pilus assembly protein PilV